MLGCHDFCGYYDWTFHHVRSAHGQEAVEQLWSEAIGNDSQLAYLEAAQRAGLRGLLEVWTHTGEDEQCDWTFTLDEERNVLRWDMRACPSKGFLLDNDLNADEDYCNHCMGWIAPLLAKAGVEVAAHEHNHCGQCWAEMRVTGRPYQSLNLPEDIRKDARWSHGYIDRFEAEAWNTPDPIEAIAAAFRRCCDPLIVADIDYEKILTIPRALVLGDDPALLQTVAAKWLATPAHERPILLHGYLPSDRRVDFAALKLPRPLPILPLLIRTGLYTHTPHSPPPSVETFAQLLSRAISLL